VWTVVSVHVGLWVKGFTLSVPPHVMWCSFLYFWIHIIFIFIFAVFFFFIFSVSNSQLPNNVPIVKIKKCQIITFLLFHFNALTQCMSIYFEIYGIKNEKYTCHQYQLKVFVFVSEFNIADNIVLHMYSLNFKHSFIYLKSIIFNH
jgi:hypothetical protein